MDGIGRGHDGIADDIVVDRHVQSDGTQGEHRGGPDEGTCAISRYGGIVRGRTQRKERTMYY